jgi:N-ethylmaleimide reductase
MCRTPIAPVYYAQRASAGLIITEASQVSTQGIGYIRTPGIHTPEQVLGWKKVTAAVHDAGGRIFLQLWHVGRISHPDFHGGKLPVAPSAIAIDGEAFTPQGRKKLVTPRALDTDEVESIVKDFKNVAINAKEAGFDGVEIHGANGYLLEEFLRDGANQRTDRYGGSLQNRLRFPLEVTQAVIEVFGASRVGYRISPHSNVPDTDVTKTYSYLTTELSQLNVSYLHVLEMTSPPVAPEKPLAPLLRTLFKGPFMVNGGYNFQTASSAIETGQADLVSFGRLFLANPDLPERFRTNHSLNTPDPNTFYSGEEKGYIDYPTITEGKKS